MNRYLEVEKFEKKEFALALIENRKSELEKRVGNYQPFSVDLLGMPNFPFSQKNETDKREIDALYVASQMARRGFSNFLWISGPGGDHNYPDTRITWLKVANVTSDKIYFDDNKAICSDIRDTRCLELVECLKKNGGEVLGEPKDIEELRSYVVGFKDDQIIERLADSLTEMEGVWEAIKSGKDNDNLKEMMEVADWVESRFGSQMRQVKTERESVMVGALIERVIHQRFGVMLMMGGAHGMSNNAALGQMNGVFDTINGIAGRISRENLDSRLEICDGCGNCYIKKKKKCPKCYPEK